MTKDEVIALRKQYTYLRHAELIKAWADGAVIQYKSRSNGQWQDCGHNNPRWNALIDYRVKPQEPQSGAAIRSRT